jgi:hypothetical protein
VPPAPAIVTPPPAAQPKTFNDLILRLQGLFQLQTGDAAYVAGLQARIGSKFGITVASINDIQSRPDCIQWTLDTITADGK